MTKINYIFLNDVLNSERFVFASFKFRAFTKVRLPLNKFGKHRWWCNGFCIFLKELHSFRSQNSDIGLCGTNPELRSELLLSATQGTKQLLTKFKHTLSYQGLTFVEREFSERSHIHNLDVRVFHALLHDAIDIDKDTITYSRTRKRPVDPILTNLTIKSSSGRKMGTLAIVIFTLK